jgi:hypothetical protein
MNCSVIRDENGIIKEVLAQNGNASSLYYDLLMEFNDPEQALQEYALTLTTSFNNKFGDAALDENGEHTIDTYKQFTTGVSAIKPGVKELFESNSELANQVYEALRFKTPKKSSTNIASTIYELIPNITDGQIDQIYDNYVALMGRTRKGKQISKDVFKNLINSYQVFNYKDTYIFGQYDVDNAVFITRLNSSPSSKELLAEALPALVKQGIDFASFVPIDVANKYKRSGYSLSTQSFDYNFKGEDMLKYLAVSNPNVSIKVFGKGLKDLSAKDINEYNDSQKLGYTPVEIKGDLIEKAGKDLSKILETYLNQFGIVVKDINEIKDNLEIDELGFADILSKIAYVKDKKDLPPIAGEFIAYMMQYNPLVSDIIKELSQTNNYKNLDKSEYFKIIGGLISNDLQNKLEGNYSKSLLQKLKQLIKEFFSLLNNTPVDLINKNIGIISNNILQQNKKLITASLYKPGAFGKPTKQVSLQEAIDSDKFGASIINKLSKKGFILTGSTSLGEQGTIQRPDENLLHDIDWVSSFNRKETERLLKQAYPEAIKIRDIYGEGYITDTWIITPEGYKITNLKKETSYNIITSYNVVDKNNKIVGTYRLETQKESSQKKEIVTGIEAKVIDFFTYEEYNQRKPFEKAGIKLANWKDIFKAKLQFARYKDIWDYNRFIPKENTNQVTPQQKQQAQQQYSAYLNTIFPDSKVKDIVYHVGYNIIEEFTKRDNGIFFTDNLEYAKNLIIEKIKRDSEYAGYTMSTEEAKKALKVYSVLLNSSNIKNLSKVNSQIIKNLKRENFDTVKGIEDSSNEIESYAVFEPEQIHILGSRQDIEGFKEFVNTNPQQNTDIGFTLFKEVEQFQLIGSHHNQNLNHNQNDQVMRQAIDATNEQKKTLRKIMGMHGAVSMDSSHVYTTENKGDKIELQSTTKVLNNDVRFKFEGESDSKYLMWGNIADTILSGIIIGKSKQETMNMVAEATEGLFEEYMSQEAIDKLFTEFEQFYNEESSKGNLVLTQVKTYNLEQLIAGTLDVLIIQPDGRVQVIDLKTSYKPFTGKESSFRQSFSTIKNNIEVKKASKYQRYSSQLSIYAALLEHNGIELAEQETVRILPIKVNAQDNYVSDIERETPFIEGNYYKEYAEKYRGKRGFKYMNIFQQILNTLNSFKQRYESEGKITEADQIGLILDDISGLDYASGVNKYIDEVYKEIMGSSTKTGYKQLLNISLSQLDDITDIESNLNNIMKIEQILNQYMPEDGPLKALKKIALDDNITIEKGSVGDKLFTVIDNIENMKADIQEKLPEALAKYLVRSLPAKDTTAIVQEYNDLLEKESKIKRKPDSSRKERQLKDIQVEITKLEQQFKISRDNKDPNLEAILIQEIRDGGYVDISVLERWVESPMQLPVAYLSAFALKTKQEFESVRQGMIQFVPTIDSAFKEFAQGKDLGSTRPKELYEAMTEDVVIVTVNELGEQTSITTKGFVNYIDYNRFRENEEKMNIEANKLPESERSAYRQAWYQANKQARPQEEDIKTKNGVILVESIETITRRKRKEFAKYGGNADANFDKWLSQNSFTVYNEDGSKSTVYTGELAIPNVNKYKNPKFTKLEQNASDYKYYEFLLSEYFEDQKLQPPRGRARYEQYKYLLPNISKSDLDRLTENGVKNLAQYKVKDLFQRIDEDYSKEAFDTDSNKSVNILFFNKMNPMSSTDISMDLTSSIIRYKIAAQRFQKQQKLASVGELLYNRVSKVGTAKVTPSGIAKVRNFVNAMTGKKEIATQDQNNAAELLKAFIETQLYNITRKDKTFQLNGKTFDVGKIVDTIIGFGGVTTLGADITAALANALQANAMTLVESFAKKFMKPGTYLWAQKKYLLNEKDFITDSWDNYPKSLIGQLIEAYDPMQGDYNDNLGRKIGKTALKEKANVSKLLMSGMRKGEHMAAGILMLGILKDTTVMQDGKPISLIDAYHLVDGRLQLKKGVVLDSQVGQIDINVQNKIHSVSNRIFGIYNRESNVDLLRYSLGRAAMMFRKFLPQGITYRFGGKKYNYQQDIFTRGMYRDFYKYLFTDFKELATAIYNPDAAALTPLEKQNLQRALAEHALIMVTGAIVLSLSYILEGEDDDDPKVQFGKWALYLSLRLNNELATYGAAFNPATRGVPSPMPLIYSFSNVSAIFNVVKKTSKLLTQLLDDIITLSPAQYERDTGIFEKGDYKSLANLMKLIGVNNRKWLSEPDDAINTLISERGASR